MKRPYQTVVRYGEEEYQHVKGKADKRGLSVASYLREISMEDVPRRKGSLDRDAQREIWKQVAGMGRNVNQIAAVVNKDGIGRLKKGELEKFSDAIYQLTETILELAGKKR